MSYDIIRGVKIKEKEKEVLVKSASNNVFPRYYEWEKCRYFEEILKEKGKEETEIAILETYISGSFQAGSKNKYHYAYLSLLFNKDFERFNWRTYGFNVEKGCDYHKEKYREDYLSLLKNALKKGIPKDNFIITKETYNGEQVFGKKTKRFMKWFYDYDKNKATKYKFIEMAKNVKSGFSNSDNWEIIKI